MPVVIARDPVSAGPWDMFAALVERDGSLAHPYPRTLLARRGIPTDSAVADLSDIAHLLCIVHGRHPGVIDHAYARSHDDARDWLADAASGFAAERARLIATVAAAGPLPSTPGHAQAEAALTGQRHAIDTLAQSDRSGCAIGAAVALAVDWGTIRCVLDIASERFGMPSARSGMEGVGGTAALVESSAQTPASERAFRFGAQQMLAQHRGLWDLLEARHEARRHPA